jgi:hypothetical protein
MMDDGPCQPRMHAPVEQHLVTRADRTGPQPFLISVGEKLCLVGDSPSTLKLADAASVTAPSQKWVSAEFQVLDIGSVLVIRNHFDQTLRYRSIIKVPNRPPAATSVCPVRANIASLEHWPYPIETIAFGDFAVAQPGETACR